MKEKNIKKLCQMRIDERLKAISEGLDLLIENVFSINESLKKLQKVETVRGYKILRQISEEEAAKFLILIDYIRCPSKQSEWQSRQLKYFYSHFARCLYAEYCITRPASWKEVCDWVERNRQSRYLDGPLGVEWIFRNEFIDKREREIYVDYIEMDNKDIWISPKKYKVIDFKPWELKSDIIYLIILMWKCGFTKYEALKEIRDEWVKFNLNSNTRWGEIGAKNLNTIEKLYTKGIVPEEIDKNDINEIVDRWYFPLYSLDLQEKEVKEEELKEIQKRWRP